MQKYKYEMHCHTDEVSDCGRIKAKDLVEAYIENGYSGIVITDHFAPWTFEAKQVKVKDMVDFYLSGYEAAKEAAHGRIDIFLGMELRFYENINDYLVYGIDEKFLRKNTELMDMGIAGFSRLARKKNLALFQAHPFRNGMTVTHPELVDGYEIYNGNVRQDSRNDVAALWADRFSKRTVSGSDFHEWDDLARGGIAFSSPVKDYGELVAQLLNGSYEIIETE